MPELKWILYVDVIKRHQGVSLSKRSIGVTSMIEKILFPKFFVGVPFPPLIFLSPDETFELN